MRVQLGACQGARREGNLLPPSSQLGRSSKSFQAKFFARENGDKASPEVEDVDPEAFKMYATWLYTGDVGLSGNYHGLKKWEKHWLANRRSLAFVKLYHLGVQVDDMVFRNTIMDGILDYASRTSMSDHSATRTYAYSSTPKGSLLRTMLVKEALAQRVPEGWIRAREQENRVPAEFAEELRAALATIPDRNTVSPTKAGICAFHEHDKEHPERCCDGRVQMRAATRWSTRAQDDDRIFRDEYQP